MAANRFRDKELSQTARKTHGRSQRAAARRPHATRARRARRDCRGSRQFRNRPSLGLSEKTVRNHITRVFDKIGVEHRYEAIVRARDAGLGMKSRLTSAR